MVREHRRQWLDEIHEVRVRGLRVLDVELDLVSQSHPDGARNMGKNDLCIAACTMVAGATLLTTDNDLGLTPLALNEFGEWDPANEYWGEEGEPIEDWAKPIIARGRRPTFEMEQVLPGSDPEDFDSDPVLEANDLKDAGDIAGAQDTLAKMLEADLRCLDANAHLGNMLFRTSPHWALSHYEVGVRIGELSLGADFDGVLAWGLIDRPFLCCMQGYGLCLWRLERWDEAERVFERMLWMSPSDNQGIRGLLPDVRAREAWVDDEE